MIEHVKAENSSEALNKTEHKIGDVVVITGIRLQPMERLPGTFLVTYDVTNRGVVTDGAIIEDKTRHDDSP